jgi:AAA ATPase domain
MPNARRILQNLVSDVGQFQDKFNQLRLALQEDAATNTSVTAMCILDVVRGLCVSSNLNTALRLICLQKDMELQLNDIPYAAGVQFDADKGCLPGTREKVIAEICNWVNQDSDDTPRIFFLNGVAGAGKSAIAHEIAQRFDRLNRLGSSYCVDHALQAKHSANNIFSTIARDLVDVDPERKALLWRVVGERRALRTTHVPREQFQKFILDTNHGQLTVGPTVIVIDALDAIGNQESREGLLSVLGNEAGQLPPNFRIFVTGRAEPDILEALVGRQHVLSMCVEDIDPKSTNDDISLYVQTQLGNIVALERKWPNKVWCGLLVEKSEGSFQWAATACRFVRGDGKYRDPVDQMERLLVQNHLLH